MSEVDRDWIKKNDPDFYNQHLANEGTEPDDKQISHNIKKQTGQVNQASKYWKITPQILLNELSNASIPASE